MRARLRQDATVVRLRAARFHADQRGLSALEFAFMAPLLIGMLMGIAEITNFILSSQKSEKMSFTVADILAQREKITADDLTEAATAASLVMKPFPFGTSGKVFVTSVSLDPANTTKTKVRWRCTATGTLASVSSKIGNVGAVSTLDKNMFVDDKDSIVATEVYYKYLPIMDYFAWANQTFYKVSYFRPRLGDMSDKPAGC